MKFVVSQLKVGDVVAAEVVEVISAGQLIVNFNGDLMRVSNRTFMSMQVGQRVALKVQGLHPLTFQLVRRRFGLDVSV